MPEDSPIGSDDPAVVETLVVHAEDVVTAYEARHRGGDRAVIRITPPFSARMRGRIHVHTPGEYADLDGPRPVHVEPAALLADDAPAYPEPDETAAELDGAADPETHHDHHRQVVADWRERAAAHLRERVAVETDGATVSLDVAVLG